MSSDPEFAMTILTMSETELAIAFLKSVLFIAYARFIKTDHCISGLHRGMVARLLDQWHLKQRIRIQRASKKSKPKVFNQLDIDFQFDSLMVYLFPMSPCTK